MRWNKKSRRLFLQGAGTSLALPFLASLQPKDVEADPSTQKTFVGIGAWNGLFKMYGPESQLMPKTPESGSSLVGLTQVDVPGRHPIHHGDLSSIAQANGGQVSDIIDSSYNALLPKMLMMQGFDYIGLGYYHHSGQFGNWHRTADATEGNPDMATLDVVLAEWFASQGMPGDLVAYSASNRDESSGYGCSWKADGSYPTSMFHDPATLWTKYFENATIPTNIKELLVDRVYADYQSLQSNPRLGAEDRQRLNAHVEHIATTQQKVKQFSAVCQQLQPTVNPDDRSMVLQTMNDVIVGLIACGMCNSFMGWAQALVSEDPDQWHVWSHQGWDNDNGAIADSGSYDNMVEQTRGVMKDMCLDLASKLDALGLLDNCLIACIQEHNKRGHESWNVPAITFGSAGGAFKTGQYVDFRNIGDRDDLVFSRFGYPMNQLYANILLSMGMPAASFEALNRTRADGVGSPFKPGSGYGVNTIHPDSAFNMGEAYASWNGHDMSEWLPLLTG